MATFLHFGEITTQENYYNILLYKALWLNQMKLEITLIISL